MPPRPTPPVRALLAGLGAALAVALPLSLVAQILDVVIDDGLSDGLRAALAVGMMIGPVVGGVVSSRRLADRRRWPLAFAVGGIALGLVALLGAVRASADEDADVPWRSVPALAVWGGALALAGAAGAGATARTRS